MKLSRPLFSLPRPLRPLPCLGLLLLALNACGAAPADGPEEPAAGLDGSSPPALRFTDVTETAGVTFAHENGASPQRYLPETMGAGVAFFDLDGDGRADLFFADGAPVTEGLEGPGRDQPAGRLYRNLGDGTFEDVTSGAGLGSAFLAMGVAVGDADGDGRADLFVSGVGEQRLYRNLGGMKFRDVTATAGLSLERREEDVGFGSSAAFFDPDKDGDLDLVVGRYVPWSPSTDVRCSPDGERHTYCTPEVYRSAANVFYRNIGDGTFQEATAEAGLAEPAGKTLGLAVFDADGDGWPDLAVANDTDRNHLFLNRGGTFEEGGIERGLAFSVSGAPRGAMGIDVGDVDGDGLDDVAIGNFAQELSALYMASPAGLFRDDAARLGVGLPSLMQVAFGTLLVDLDLDGRLDLVLANGHIEPEIAQYQGIQSYRQPLGIYRNLLGAPGEADRPASNAFVPVKAESGPLAEAYVARGLAAADFDGDGDPDLVLTQNGGPARLLRNDSPAAASRWLRIRLESAAGPRPPYGARITVVAGDRRIERSLRSGHSYLSAGEAVVTFGLGNLEAVDRLEIRWPSGRKQVVEGPELGKTLVVEEPGA